MKERFKGLLIGIILGILIASGSALAITGTIQKNLEYNNIKITLNNRQINTTDANGNYVEPFIIDGTTYLPVRAIATALGLNVSWDGATNTVILSETTTTTHLSSNSNISIPAKFRTAKFPLHLYSNDQKTYLGKLVTNKYDSDSIFNEYGTYGSKYGSKSIWNEYGTYGSDYSSQSAFNEYASSPPIIVDNNRQIIGYLTANDYKSGGVTILELQQILIACNQ